MSPKEKALELINKFDGYTHYAEWVVDEILDGFRKLLPSTCRKY